MPFNRSALLASVLLWASSAGAQVCLAAHPPMGQPSLEGITPVCFDTVPITVLQTAGNPEFEIASFAPAPITPGSPTWLVFYLNQEALAPAPPVAPFCFDELPLIPSLVGAFTVFAGPAGAVPGEAVEIPLPPLAPGGPIRVHTVGIDSEACVFATDGITLNRQSTPSLWISDDFNQTILEVTVEGDFLGSFFAGTAVSCVALDWSTDTIWTTSEGLDRVFNFNKDGEVLSEFSTLDIDPMSTQPEGIDVDPFDATLWMVDDTSLLVYHLERDGTLIDSFLTTDFHSLALSPQAIACAPDDTLWITDNSSDRIYNVTKTGQEISRFATTVFDPLVINPQGISFDQTNGTLWISSRTNSTVYNVSQTGDLLSSFTTTSNPTGVASSILAGNSR